MACLVGTDAFKSLEIHAAQVGIPELPMFGSVLAEGRKLLCDRQGDTFEANAWWQELIARARRVGEPWQLATIWMALPGSAAIKNPPSTQRLEGERLGALADKLGLRAAIRKVEHRIFDDEAMDFADIFSLPEMIDIGVAADALGISTTTEYKRIKNRTFPCAVLRRAGAFSIPAMSLAIAMGINPLPVDPLDFLRGARFSALHDWK
ncbi:hypothetical protein ABH935_009555 [Catenulispora sp. GAS73]|uniref:hypothetical protein n=1 Tax=Catenulispora sp. GAS73 TaxID=3156269 RepID=UPI003516A0A5